MDQNLNSISTTACAGMFDLGNGTYAYDFKERFKIRSIVAAVDTDNGKALGLCPVQSMMPLSLGVLHVQTAQIDSGREATKVLLEAAEKQGLVLPAVDFCRNYEGFGVQKGEAFLASGHELRYVAMSQEKILRAFKKLGLTRTDNSFLSTAINQDCCVWVLSLNNRAITGWKQLWHTGTVMPMIEITL